MSGDSLVQGPYPDFVRMYASRVTLNRMKRELAWELNAQGELLRSVRSERDAALAKLAATDALRRAVAEEKHQRDLDLQRCAEKRERLRTWATIGKVVVFGGLAVGVASVLLP